MFSRILSLGAAALLCISLPSLAAPPSDTPEHFPPVKLRAYGTLAGDLKTVPGSPQSSVLRITCESIPKAQLVLAKYLSDLGLLPGVTPLSLESERGPFAAQQVDKQGVVAAARCGMQVYIFTAADGPALKTLISTDLPTTTKIDATAPEVTVPMYVDRWDKYGFRFYYGPFIKPQDSNHHEVPSYDPRQDFTFADQTGKDGLVVWNSPFTAASADGIMDTISRDWVYKAAQPLKLPLGINIGLADGNIPLTNRYPGGIAPYGGPYIGGWYYEAPSGIPTLAWSSTESQEAGLSQLKNLVTDLDAKYDNIVNWLEPHEETSHGIADQLDDHGPDAKKSFYAFLKTKYRSVNAVAKRYGAHYTSWNDVPFPELATFFGWNENAINLAGLWKISSTAPYDASSAKPDLDDSSWASIDAPENAIIRCLPRKPTVLRRHITIDPAWKASHPKVYLYLWDLENPSPRPNAPGGVMVYVNGQFIPQYPEGRMIWHWCGDNITSALHDGDNLITYYLPDGIIIYRSYLSGDAPGIYPALSPEMNARWADFSDWTSWSRAQAVRRGMQMVRQVDPDKPITLMSPGFWWDDYKASAEDYGAILHDTGGMAGFWNDINPATAQSTGLPTDCEPGGPAPTLDEFKKYMGRWSTENTQGVDYFGHLGDVLWNPEIKDYFQKTLPLWHLIGKYHLPQPEVADLTSLRTERLFGYPFNTTDHGSTAPDLIATGPGVFASGIDGELSSTYSRGGVIEGDFARGTADQYRVVVDTNSSILDPDIVDAIAKWVKRGGTFVTFQQTGRHTSTQHDVWPISKLTGYNVLSVERKSRHFTVAPNQPVFPAGSLGDFTSDWGMTLQKADPTCQDLIVWDDGTVAAGMRKLGKGMVIDFGMFDSDRLILKALDWMKIKHVPGEITAGQVTMRSFVSNNGLYNVWTMWNQKDSPVTADLIFHDGVAPCDCSDVNTGNILPITTDSNGARIANIAFDSYQTRVFLTPRAKLAQAPADWFTLQRNWWKGTANPGPAMPSYKSKLALDLSNDAAFKVIPGDFTVNPPEDPTLSDPKLDDSSWQHASLGIFDIPDNVDAHHVVFRKHFTVPAAWNHGTVSVFGKSESPGNGGIRRYMDGKLFGGQIVIDNLGGTLTPGSTHVLTTEMWGAQPPLGTTTPAWISYRPDPQVQLSLSDWSFAKDCLTYTGHSSIPLTTTDSGAERCEVVIDPKQQAHNVVIHVVCDNAGIGAIIFNGSFYASYGNIWNFMDINVTPYVKFGQKNQVVVMLGDKTTMKKASIDFYPKDVYP